jgi:hypothetical protein
MADRRLSSLGDTEDRVGEFVALAVFIIFIAMAASLLTHQHLLIPWSEMIVATILLYATSDSDAK